MLTYSNESTAVPIITIDGPSGAGKGTVASLLAQRLHWHFLDSGAIYRCLAYLVHRDGVAVDDISAIVAIASSFKPRFICFNDKHYAVWLDNEDVTDTIRDEIIGQVASKISGHNEVRAALFDCQRLFAQEPGLIADGRDMGTVIFPDADLKIFLDASPEERARRRYLQLTHAGQTADLSQITQELRLRDARDREREVAPLRPASDAVVIDTTNLDVKNVVNQVFELAAINHLVTIQQAQA